MRLLASIVLLLAIGSANAQDVPTSFGDRQLAQLLDDRPSMKGILTADDTICRWVIRRFNTGHFGQRVHWDHGEPVSGREAESQASWRIAPALIRITESEKVSGRDKWCLLVFEFENLQNAPLFENLVKLACAKQIPRHEFALECVQLELNAEQRAKRYFNRYPIIGATIENAPRYSALIAATGDLTTYVDWLDSRGDDEYDPREYFGKSFDQCREYSDANGPYGTMSRTKR